MTVAGSRTAADVLAVLGGGVTSALLVLSVLALLGTLAALFTVRRTRRELAAMIVAAAENRERVERLRAQAAELAEAQAAALAEAVEAGTSGVRGVHRAIADIPFDLLGGMPVTKRASNQVRQVHDRTTDGVYEAIGHVNKAASEVFRAFRRSPKP